MIQMKGYKINSLEFENKVENGTQLKLQNHVKYNVNYIDAETDVWAFFTLELKTPICSLLKLILKWRLNFRLMTEMKNLIFM